MKETKKKPHVHECHRCGCTSATWSAAELPRGWVRFGGGVTVCKRCSKKGDVR